VDEVESVMHELGTAFAVGLTRPGSMQASLTAHGQRSQTYDVAGNPALIGRWGALSGTDVYALMDRLRSITGVDGPFVVELTGSPVGDYVVSYCAGGDSGELPALEPIVVRDAGYRFPDHPTPGMARPVATVNDGRPTDPAVLAEVQTLVAAVATFPALRVLTLDATQWLELLGTGWTPQRLAAARLGGRGGVPGAATWHTAIRGAGQPTVQHRTIRGQR
jgi:hypothetical protein